MGRDSILNLVEGRQPEPHRPLPPRRIDAIHAEPQSRAVAPLCEFNGLAGDGLGFAFHQGLGGHGNAMASAFRLAVGISRLSFLKGHELSVTFAAAVTPSASPMNNMVLEKFIFAQEWRLSELSSTERVKKQAKKAYDLSIPQFSSAFCPCLVVPQKLSTVPFRIGAKDPARTTPAAA